MRRRFELYIGVKTSTRDVLLRDGDVFFEELFERCFSL